MLTPIELRTYVVRTVSYTSTLSMHSVGKTQLVTERTVPKTRRIRVRKDYIHWGIYSETPSIGSLRGNFFS